MILNSFLRSSMTAETIDVGISHQFVKSNTSSVLHKQHRESNASSPLSSENKPFKSEIRWTNVLLFIGIHLAALYGFYLGVTQAKWATFPWAFVLMAIGGYGSTGGAHRLWCHKSYKANLPLRILTAIAHTIALNGTAVDWARNHRVHHKFTETNADPHDARRGFFFAHVGWLLCTEHPDVKVARRTVNLSDVYADPVANFQQKYYGPLILVLCFWMPAFVPWYFWGESFETGFFFAFLFRLVLSLHMMFLVNSLAHTHGSHPYDKTVNPTENTFVALCTLGEGWHNYHHIYPADYKAGELGFYGTNWTAAVIEFFAAIGWAYDLKSVSQKAIKNRVLRTGDGTHPYSIQEKQLQVENVTASSSEEINCEELQHDEGY